MRKFNTEFRSLSGKLSRRQPDGTYKRMTTTDARLLLNDFSAHIAELEARTVTEPDWCTVLSVLRTISEPDHITPENLRDAFRAALQKDKQNG